MARINIVDGIGKYAPSVFVIEIEGGGGFSPTASIAVNPKHAVQLLKQAKTALPALVFRISEYVRLEGISNCAGITVVGETIVDSPNEQPSGT